MSTHALRTSEPLRHLDLAALTLALAVFVAAGLPLLGWAATTGAWLLARVVEAFAERSVSDRRSAMRARAVALIGRLYLVGLTVLAAGLIDRDAGVAAGALALAVFTVYFAATLAGRRS